MPNVGSVVSIVGLQKTFKNSVSLLVSKNQSQKLINGPYPYNRESACVYVYVYALLLLILLWYYYDYSYKMQGVLFHRGFFYPMPPVSFLIFLWCIELIVTLSKRIFLVGVWKVVFDPDLDRGRASRETINLDAKYFSEFVPRLVILDKYREKYPIKVKWTNKGASG